MAIRRVKLLKVTVAQRRKELLPYFSDEEFRETLSNNRKIRLWAIRRPALQNETTYVYKCSGAKYVGSWKEGFRHGTGSMKWSDGATYEGEWSWGQPSGKGRFQWPTTKEDEERSSMIKLNYLADFDIPEHSSYEGSWSANLMHGFGALQTIDGKYYKGEWSFGLRQGKGHDRNQDGEYFGEYMNDCKAGLGVRRTQNCIYYGQWSNDVIDGLGFLESNDNRNYKGQWNQGVMQGVGELVFANGKKYSGEFLNDKKHGFGTHVWEDGRSFKGGWKNGRQHGLGTYSFSIAVDQETKVKKFQTKYGFWTDGKLVKWLQASEDDRKFEHSLNQFENEIRKDPEFADATFKEPEDFSSKLFEIHFTIDRNTDLLRQEYESILTKNN